jgi:DNA-3-methyladenine glycosylase II
MPAFTLTARGPYSLRASARFLEGFAPAAYQPAEDRQHLHWAFAVDGSDEVAGVCLRGDDRVRGEVFGDADPKRVCAQVERVLSLDVDGRAFPEVARRDPVVATLQARYRGLRPVCFFSPYEAGAWALIGHRLRIRRAAQLKARISAALGPAVDIHGDRRHAFPSPAELVRLAGFPGLSDVKRERLRALATAARDGLLDAARLRSMSGDDALADLKRLPGIGDFSAELILIRGAGEPDRLPEYEPRLLSAVARAYGLEREPEQHELRSLAGRWRPYRSWVAVLLRTFLEDETSDIRGQSHGRRSTHGPARGD